MAEKSLAHPTRPVRVDPALLEEISQLTGIEYWALSSALVSEEKALALAGITQMPLPKLSPLF